jgi:hypothetical protein
VALGCNDYRYTVFGPGNYGITTWGQNINATPPAAVTSTPSIRISVPTPGNPSTMIASIMCIANGVLSTFPWSEQLTFTYNIAPSIIWGQEPPNIASPNSTHNISVSSVGNSTVSWSVSPFGASVTSTGPLTADLTVWTPGIKNVTATITDICTGQTASVSKQVNVQ